MTDLRKSKAPFYMDVDGFRLPGFFSEEAYRSALAYQPRPDDLFIVAYPKCGTTWVQYIVSCIYNGGRPFTSAVEFYTQTPFLEMVGSAVVDSMKRPGALKVHLPYRLTPWSPQSKYIFVARNPKDCCVSDYHHTVNIPGYRFADGKFDDYFELFIEGKVDFGDYFDTLMSWYEHRNNPNVLFITYEQLKKHNMQYVLKIAEFMGPQYREALEKGETLLSDVIHHSSFSFMKATLNKYISEFNAIPKDVILNHPDVPQGIKHVFGAEGTSSGKDKKEINFIRKGIVGGWKNYLTPEQNERLEEKFRQRTRGTELETLWRDDM